MQSSLKMDKPIFVSISCITYNHEKFIRQCIEGFLMQKTNFPIEILIFDDASTDGAQQIIQEYASKDHRIITFLQNENQWSKGKYGLLDWLFPAAKGKYIALCEGDDYWTDPLKLQKQVDFLEANPEYSMTFHKVKIYNEIEHKFEEDVINDLTKEDTNLHDLLKGNYIRTVSAVIRNTSQLASLIDKIKTATPGDWLLFIIIASTRKIKYMNQEMAVYRISYSGVWSTIDNKQRKYHKELLNGYEFLYKFLKKDDYAIVYHSHMHYIGLAAIINKENKKFARFIAYKILLYYRILKFRYFGGSKYLTE
jgi:glycosyltransferase involved in cell wall biosynthesis